MKMLHRKWLQSWLSAVACAIIMLILGCKTTSVATPDMALLLMSGSDTLTTEPASFVFEPIRQQSSKSDGPATPQSSEGVVVLRMHGSNTIGAQLAPALAEAFLRKKGAENVKIVPRGPEEVMVQGLFPGDSSIKSIKIAEHGSSTAFTDLLEKCDIGNASRPIRPEEVAELSSVGDMIHPHRNMFWDLMGSRFCQCQYSVRALSTEQIRKVFDGDLSTEHARIVAEELRMQSVKTPVVIGLCDESPIASNQTAEGRQKTGEWRWLRR